MFIYLAFKFNFLNITQCTRFLHYEERLVNGILIYGYITLSICVHLISLFYTFAMNAQTGEFVGNIPTSKGRTFMFGSLVFALMFLAIFIICFLFFKGGM